MEFPNTGLDLDSLRCFVAAATRASFRSAASAVHLSPAAFGDRIRRLEDGLGAQLFTRTTRSLRLSEAGERLLPTAKRVLEGVAEIPSAVHGDRETPYSLLVGTRYELGLSWLVPALAALERDQPGRQIHLYFGDSDALLAQVAAERIDAALTSVRLTLSGLEYAPLHEERYVFVAAPALVKAHPLRRPEDAARHTLLDSSRELPLFRYLLDALPPEPAWTFGREEHLGTIAAIRARALAGAGVAVLPEYFVREELRRKKLVRLFKETRLSSDWFRLIWRAGHPRAPALRRLADALQRMPLR
ncbi:MAG: LysR family transcriptional regulator [Myxococcota bacterium]